MVGQKIPFPNYALLLYLVCLQFSILKKTHHFRGKFWVFGGSTGDDSYDHTITDKVQAYNPRQAVNMNSIVRRGWCYGCNALLGVIQIEVREPNCLP